MNNLGMATAFVFSCEEAKQKTLVDALLKYSQLSFQDLSFVLDLPTSVLEKVHAGLVFLEAEAADNLFLAFLAFFGNIS